MSGATDIVAATIAFGMGSFGALAELPFNVMLNAVEGMQG